MPSLDDLARHSFVVKPHAPRGTLTVTGPERSAWLEGLVTCELKGLQPGQGAWGLALNRQGKIQSDVWVAASADALWLSLAPGTVEGLETELDRMLIMEDAELERPREPHVWLALHGPEAPARAEAFASAHGGFAGSIDWTGLGGAALVVPEAQAPAVMASAQPHLLGEADWVRLRLERNLPEFGVDFDARDRPHEAALDRRAVSWTKGCYLGQEVVCMQDMRGKVKRSLALLCVSAPEDGGLQPGGVIVDGTRREVGAVTSLAPSLRAGGWLVMARLERSALGGELFYAEGGAAGPFPAIAFEPRG